MAAEGFWNAVRRCVRVRVIRGPVSRCIAQNHSTVNATLGRICRHDLRVGQFNLADVHEGVLVNFIHEAVFHGRVAEVTANVGSPVLPLRVREKDKKIHVNLTNSCYKVNTSISCKINTQVYL